MAKRQDSGSSGAGGSNGSGGAAGGGSDGGGDARAGSASVDPCSNDHGGCDRLAACTSSGASVTCGACPPGYIDSHRDGTLCTDVDECATSHGRCDPMVSCTNIAGSRICGPCPMYYRGDGDTGCIHLWTQELGTTLGTSAYGVATDTRGNVYVTGYTSGGLDGNTNAGSTDLFVVKYDSPGEKQWTRQFGTISGDGASGVATDGDGNVYVTGQTWGGLGGNTNAGNADVFIVKYDGTDPRQWTYQFGTPADDEARGVATDKGGNVYVTGYTAGSLDGNTNAGNTDVFIVEYDGAGHKQWSRQFGTPAEDIACAIATDTSGNVYVTGYTLGGLDGNTNAGGDDVFVVKYDGTGQKQWTRQLGSTADDDALGVAADAGGNVYVTGGTQGDLDGTANAGRNDVFVVKYDGAGEKQWTRQLRTTADDEGRAVATDMRGNVYVTGYTAGGLDGNTNAGSYDLFVVSYDSAGQKQWTRQLGSTADDHAYGIAIDANGNAYVTGETQGGLDDNTNSGNYDLFIVKYDADGHRL